MPPGGAPPGGGYPPAGGPPGGGYPPAGYGGPGMPAGAQPGYGGPGGPMGAAPPKKGKGLLIGGIIGGVLLLAIIAGVLFFALSGSKKTSKAHEHLPASCVAVVRVDIKGLLDVDAVKEHVRPVLDKKAKESEDASKMARFLITAGLDPRKDLHEAVVCLASVNLLGGEPDIVAIVGGDLVQDGILDALDKHGDKDKFAKSTDKKGMRVVVHKQESLFITQADDAALIISNKMSLLKKATETGDFYKKEYDIPLKEQVVGVLTKKLLTTLTALAAATPLGGDVGGVGRVVVTGSLDPGQLGARLQMGSKDEARKLRDSLNTMLQEIKKGGVPDPKGQQLLEGAKVKSKGDEVLLEVPVPKKMIEDGVKDFAKAIDEADEEI
jgi:hypothetical protein